MFNSLAKGVIANSPKNVSPVNSTLKRCKATDVKFGEDTVSGDFTMLAPDSSISIVNGCLTSTDVSKSTKYEFENFEFNQTYEIKGIYKINGKTQTDSLVLKSCADNVKMMQSGVTEETYNRSIISIKFNGNDKFKINDIDEECTIAGTLDTVFLFPVNTDKKQEWYHKISVTITTSKGVEYKSNVDYSYNMLNKAISDFTIKSISLNGKDFKPESIKETTKNVLTNK